MSPRFSTQRSALCPEIGSPFESLATSAETGRQRSSRAWSWCLMAAMLATSGCQSSGGLSRFFVKTPLKKSGSTLSVLDQDQDKPGLPIPTRKAQAGSTDVASHLDAGEAALSAYYQDSETKHLVEARRNYQTAIQKQSGCPEAHHGLAIVCDLQQDFTTAELHYRAAIDGDPNNSSVLGDLGYSLLLQGKLNQSEEMLKQATKADPSNVKAFKNLAEVYAKTGRVELAAATYRRVLNENEVQQELALLFPNGVPQANLNSRGQPDDGRARTDALRNRIQEARENDLAAMRQSLEDHTAVQLNPQQQQAEAFRLQTEREAAQWAHDNQSAQASNAPIMLDAHRNGYQVPNTYQTGNSAQNSANGPANQPSSLATTYPGSGAAAAMTVRPGNTTPPPGGRRVQNGFYPQGGSPSPAIQQAGATQQPGPHGDPRVEQAFHQTQQGIDPRTGLPSQQGIQQTGGQPLLVPQNPAQGAPASVVGSYDPAQGNLPAGHSDTAAPAPTANAGFEEAKRRAALVGLAGPEMMFPVVSGTQRVAPGTGSALGAEYPQVQRYLPIDAPPHDLQAISQAPAIQMTVPPNQLGQSYSPAGPRFANPNFAATTAPQAPAPVSAWGQSSGVQDQAQQAQQAQQYNSQQYAAQPNAAAAPPMSAYQNYGDAGQGTLPAYNDPNGIRVQPVVGQPDARRGANTELYQYGETMQPGAAPNATGGQSAWGQINTPSTAAGQNQPQPATGSDLMRAGWNGQSANPGIMPPPYPGSPAAANNAASVTPAANAGFAPQFPAPLLPRDPARYPQGNEPPPIYSPGARVPAPYNSQPAMPSAPAGNDMGLYDGPRIRPATR